MKRDEIQNAQPARPATDTRPEGAAKDKPSQQEASKEAERPESAEKQVRKRRWLVVAIMVVLVFLGGFLPMWMKAERNADERDSARREMELLRLESLAAAAAIDARRGEYESARQATSNYFTALREELDLGARSALNSAQQEALKTLLTHRDGLITLLARSDASSAERLAEVYLATRKAIHDG